MTTVRLPWPPPLSDCFTNAKGKGRVPTLRYKAWQANAMWEIKTQRVQPVKGAVSVYVRLVAPDKRHRDAGNLDKAIMDILVKGGVIEDDSNRYVKRLTYEWMADGPPVTVLIQAIEEQAA